MANSTSDEKLKNLKELLQAQLAACKKFEQQHHEEENEKERRSVEKDARWDDLHKNVHQIAADLKDLQEDQRSIRGKLRAVGAV